MSPVGLGTQNDCAGDDKQQAKEDTTGRECSTRRGIHAEGLVGKGPVGRLDVSTGYY
jgi:hypothetical protein